MRKNIILCGVGGQGIVLTSKLLAASAMAKGIPVMSAETIGMAQKAAACSAFCGWEMISAVPCSRKGLLTC